mgnify:CR=1 FL=1
MEQLKLLLLLAIMSTTVYSQTGVSGFMKPKGEKSFSVSFTSENYDDVFLAPSEINGVPVFNEVSRNSYNFYADAGLTDRLMLSVNLPYINSEGEATSAVLEENGYENQRENLQDLSLNIKYLVKSFDLSNSNLNLMANLGFATPLSDYKVDESFQSIIGIGNQSTRFNGIGIAQYKLDSGFFATGQLGYSARTEDVPDAVLSQFKLGYAGSKFYGDVSIGSQRSTSGVDIIGEGFENFPETRVSYTKIGISLFAPLSGNLGLSAGASQLIDGLNIGKIATIFGGITYSL